MVDKVGYQGKTSTGKGEWLTPPELIKALGPFDLDPCAPKIRPWHTAFLHYHERGLEQHWHGRVWVNPPYDQCEVWFEKAAHHGNAIGLCFNRTETEWFEKVAWNRAHGLLFKKGRIKFYNADGTIGGNGPGAGSVFIAYGKESAAILEAVSFTTIPGKFIRLK